LNKNYWDKDMNIVWLSTKGQSDFGQMIDGVLVHPKILDQVINRFRNYPNLFVVDDYGTLVLRG